MPSSCRPPPSTSMASKGPASPLFVVLRLQTFVACLGCHATRFWVPCRPSSCKGLALVLAKRGSARRTSISACSPGCATFRILSVCETDRPDHETCEDAVRTGVRQMFCLSLDMLRMLAPPLELPSGSWDPGSASSRSTHGAGTHEFPGPFIPKNPASVRQHSHVEGH